MSGGGGGDYTPVNQAGPCDKLQAETALQSPNPAVVGTIQKGDQLELQIEPVGNRHAVMVMKDGQRAGSLVFAKLQKLIECMRAGHEYVAEVRAVSGPSCRLKIRSK